jgi:hypothetical protein
VAASVAEYENNAAALDSRLATVDDEAWVRPVRLIADGKVMWEAPLGDMLFGFLFDAIHHRGQLSSYLRPMGGESAGHRPTTRACNADRSDIDVRLASAWRPHLVLPAWRATSAPRRSGDTSSTARR